jgi:hypothetical protein
MQPVDVSVEGKGFAPIYCLFSPSFSFPNAELENRSFLSNSLQLGKVYLRREPFLFTSVPVTS